MRFPKIDEVASELRAINKQQSAPDGDDGGIDVRLQVYPDGDWAVRGGLSDYDQDHRGYWGASSVPGDNRRFDSKALARDLIDQAKEHHAQGGDNDADLEEGEADEEDDEEEEEKDEGNGAADIEFAVDDASGRQRTFKTFDEAAGFAVSLAATGRGPSNLDVLIWSRSGARAYGGDNAVEQYDEDPEASVFERLEISVNYVGRIA